MRSPAPTGSAYLLDSHVLLWWWFDPSRLSTAVHELLVDSSSEQAHGLRAGAYSQPHRDPFDRVLAAQAELERLVLLTADPQLTTFPCQTLW